MLLILNKTFATNCSSTQFINTDKLIYYSNRFKNAIDYNHRLEQNVS